MRLPFKLYDPLIAVVLAVPVGGFIYGFGLMDTTFANRTAWGVYGTAVFLQGLARNLDRVLADAEMLWALLIGAVVVFAALIAIRLYRELEFPHKRRTTTGFVTVAGLLLLFLLLKPAPEDSASLKLSESVENGSVFELSLNVPYHRLYYIDLRFNHGNEAERAFVIEAIGEAYPYCHADRKCGLATQFDLFVEQESDLPTQKVSISHSPNGHYAHDASSHWRNLGTVPLKPGKYKLIAKATNVDRRLEAVQVDLIMHPDPRGAILKD